MPRYRHSARPALDLFLLRSGDVTGTMAKRLALIFSWTYLTGSVRLLR
jgi:hypothetical protein